VYFAADDIACLQRHVVRLGVASEEPFGSEVAVVGDQDAHALLVYPGPHMLRSIRNELDATTGPGSPATRA